MTDQPLPPLVDCLRRLQSLTPTDPALIFLTKEINLYLEVIRIHGERTYLSPMDLKILFARMTDLMAIGPVHQPKPDPKEIPIGEIDLDQMEASMKRAPGPAVPKFLTGNGKKG